VAEWYEQLAASPDDWELDQGSRDHGSADCGEIAFGSCGETCDGANEWTAQLHQALPPSQHANEDREVLAKLKGFAQSDDLDLKAIGLMALDLSYGENSEVTQFYATLERSGLRKRGARSLGCGGGLFGTAYASNQDEQNAIVCFKKSLQAKPDNIVTMSHLALAYLRAAIQGTRSFG